MANKITQVTSISIAAVADIIGGVALFHEQYLMVGVILLIITNVILLVSFLKFFLSKEFRLFQNVKRPIKIINTNDNLMENEIATLKKVGFFNLSEGPSSDHKNLDMIDEHSLVILGYSRNMDNFNDIVDKVENNKVPLIVYSKDQLKTEHLEYLRNKYSWYSICNFPLKLLNDVFTILSTFPSKK
jgi:hypothetical protein